MIRFACPGCSAVFTVGDEKAGKTTTCPKCQSAMQIPAASAMDAAPPPLPPPPPPSKAGGPVLVEPCPKCKSQLTVEPRDLGADVECPTCQTVFTARKAGSKTSPVLNDDEPRRRPRDDDDRPSRRGSRRDDDDDRPRRRDSKRYDDDDDRPRRSSRRHDDDDDFDDRPRRRSRPRRRTGSGAGGGARVASAVFGFIIGGLQILCGLGLAFAGGAVVNALNKTAGNNPPAMGARPMPGGRAAPAAANNPGAGLNAIAGVGGGVIMGCGCGLAVLGGLYVFAGVGALQRRTWGKVLTIIVGLLSGIFSLFGLYSFISNLGAAEPAGICGNLVSLVIYLGHCITSLMACFGAGSDDFH